MPARKNDILLSCDHLKTLFGQSKRILADKGYSGDITIKSNSEGLDKNFNKLVRAWQDTINARIKKSKF